MTHVHLSAAQDRAGSSHRIWGWQQHMKILLSLSLVPQGNSSSPLFLPPSSDCYREGRPLLFRPLQQAAGYPDRVCMEQGESRPDLCLEKRFNTHPCLGREMAWLPGQGSHRLLPALPIQPQVEIN